jgi:protease I
MLVDVEVQDASATDFAGLVLSDGNYDADGLAARASELEFVRGFFAAGLPVAAIGDAARILVAADTVRGRQLTAAPDVRMELVRAGANWTDERVVVCEEGPSVLVTAQGRSDLPVFCRAFTWRFYPAV